MRGRRVGQSGQGRAGAGAAVSRSCAGDERGTACTLGSVTSGRAFQMCECVEKGDGNRTRETLACVAGRGRRLTTGAAA